MNFTIYLQEEVVFPELDKACDFIAKLPSFSTAQLNCVRLNGETCVWQVLIYCFDDEVDVSGLT